MAVEYMDTFLNYFRDEYKTIMNTPIIAVILFISGYLLARFEFHKIKELLNAKESLLELQLKQRDDTICRLEKTLSVNEPKVEKMITVAGKGLIVSELNNQEYFPNINFSILKNYAKRIVDKFSTLPIEKIVLYRYSSKYFSDIPSKYAVLIFVNSTIKKSSELIEQFKELSFSTGWCASEHDLGFFHRLDFDAGFKEAYKQKPENNFLDEWLFFALLSDEKIPIGVRENETNIILYQK